MSRSIMRTGVVLAGLGLTHALTVPASATCARKQHAWLALETDDVVPVAGDAWSSSHFQPRNPEYPMLECYKNYGTLRGFPTSLNGYEFGSCESCGYYSGDRGMADISKPSDCIACNGNYTLVQVNFLCTGYCIKNDNVTALEELRSQLTKTSFSAYYEDEDGKTIGHGTYQCGCRAKDNNVQTDVTHCTHVNYDTPETCTAHKQCYWGGKDSSDYFDRFCVQRNPQCKCPKAFQEVFHPYGGPSRNKTFYVISCFLFVLWTICLQFPVPAIVAAMSKKMSHDGKSPIDLLTREELLAKANTASNSIKQRTLADLEKQQDMAAMHSAKQMAGSLEEYAALEEMEAKGDLGNEVAEAERRAKEEAEKPARTLAQVLVEQKKAVEDEDFKAAGALKKEITAIRNDFAQLAMKQQQQQQAVDDEDFELASSLKEEVVVWERTVARYGIDPEASVVRLKEMEEAQIQAVNDEEYELASDLKDQIKELKAKLDDVEVTGTHSGLKEKAEKAVEEDGFKVDLKELHGDKGPGEVNGIAYDRSAIKKKGHNELGVAPRDPNVPWHPFGEAQGLKQRTLLASSAPVDGPNWMDIMHKSDFDFGDLEIDQDDLIVTEGGEGDAMPVLSRLHLPKYWFYNLTALKSGPVTLATIGIYFGTVFILDLLTMGGVYFGLNMWEQQDGDNTENIHAEDWTAFCFVFVLIHFRALMCLTDLIHNGFPIDDTIVCIPRDFCKDTLDTMYFRFPSQMVRDKWMFQLALVSCKGELGVSKNVLRRYRQSAKQTGQDHFVIEDVLATTNGHRCSIADTLVYPDIGPVSHFLCHTWDQNLNEKLMVMDAQEQQEEKRYAQAVTRLSWWKTLISLGLFGFQVKRGGPLIAERSRYYWIDVFCVNQYQKLKKGEFARYLDKEGLPDALTNPGKMVVVADNTWNYEVNHQMAGELKMVHFKHGLPLVLTRSWCIYEIYKAISTGAVQINFAMGMCDNNSCCNLGPESLYDLGADLFPEEILNVPIDPLTACASNVDDKEAIDNMMDEQGPGFDEVAHAIKAAMSHCHMELLDAERVSKRRQRSFHGRLMLQAWIAAGLVFGISSMTFGEYYRTENLGQTYAERSLLVESQEDQNTYDEEMWQLNILTWIMIIFELFALVFLFFGFYQVAPIWFTMRGMKMGHKKIEKKDGLQVENPMADSAAIKAAEFEAGKQFAHLDQNGDGVVSAEEMMAAAANDA